jgi:hypothetical protein
MATVSPARTHVAINSRLEALSDAILKSCIAAQGVVRGHQGKGTYVAG